MSISAARRYPGGSAGDGRAGGRRAGRGPGGPGRATGAGFRAGQTRLCSRWVTWWARTAWGLPLTSCLLG